MNERTIRLNFKLLRLVRGICYAWEAWLYEEAVDVGLIELIKDYDPVAYHKHINNNHSAPKTGRVSS